MLGWRPPAHPRRTQQMQHRRERICEARSSVGLRDQFVELLFVEPPDDFSVKHRGWRYGAEAQAIDRLERHAAVGGRIAERDAKPRFGAHRKRIAACCLAGLRAAELANVAPGRLVAEI